MKFLDDIPSLGECDSLETTLLILGHPMFNRLPHVMAPTVKEVTLWQQYQLSEAFQARGLKWTICDLADQSEESLDIIPSFPEKDASAGSSECASNSEQSDSPTQSILGKPICLLCGPIMPGIYLDASGPLLLVPIHQWMEALDTPQVQRNHNSPGSGLTGDPCL